MRTKQTARKSTGPHPQSDPMRNRHSQLLQTKRNSKASTSSSEPDTKVYGKGKGKQISYSRGKHLAGGVKIKPRAKPGVNVLKEIKKYQKSSNLLIPRLPFHRLVREITHNVAPESQMRYQVAALEALQDAAEHYITRLFEDSYLCTIHAKRVTLFASDMALCQRLQERR